MTDWTGSSDQFIVDTESRYPEFSDVQTSDFSLGLISNKPQSKCKCRSCVLSLRAPEIKVRSIDERYKSLLSDPMFQYATRTQRPTSPYPPLSHRSSQSIDIAPLGYVQLDNTSILILFLFLVIVFICCFYTKSLGELRSQIKSLKRMVKKDQ